jgi:hypothetical protein
MVTRKRLSHGLPASSTPHRPVDSHPHPPLSSLSNGSCRDRENEFSYTIKIPEALIEKHGYTPLTRAVKEHIFGLNAARVFGVDVHATRHELPKDYLSRIKMTYLEEGPAPSHRWYGWVTR